MRRFTNKIVVITGGCAVTEAPRSTTATSSRVWALNLIPLSHRYQHLCQRTTGGLCGAKEAPACRTDSYHELAEQGCRPAPRLDTVAPALPFGVWSKAIDKKIDERAHLGREQRSMRVESVDRQCARTPVGQ